MAFKKPQKQINGTKILIFGEAGTHKTRTALSFPDIVYIDSDLGADNYYEEFMDNLVQVSDSTTFTDAMQDIDDLQFIEDGFKSIVVDSLTKIYESQQHAALKVAEQRARKNKRAVEGENLSPKEWGLIALNSDKFLSKLFEYKKDGKTIIVISESKDKKEAVSDATGGTSYRTVGTIPNAAKGLEYEFDLVLEMVKDKNGVFQGAKVHKDRLGVTEEGSIVENPSYEIWAEAIERKRSGTTNKAEKRDFDKDITQDMDSFDSNAANTKNTTKLIQELTELMSGWDNTKKKPLVPKFKSLFGGNPDYTQSEDIDALQKALDLAKELA